MYIVETYLQDQIKELHFPIKKKKSVKVFMNLLDCIRKKTGNTSTTGSTPQFYNTIDYI